MLNEIDWPEVFGYASICCWFVVFTPQLYENYKRKNTDGVSVTFLLLWIFGDIFNLLGIILDDLMFTMLLVALYYLFADTLLMSQVLYYRYKTNGTIFEEETVIDTTASTNEQSPLLSSNNNNNAKPKYHHKQSEQTKWIVRLFFIASIFLWAFLLLGSATYFFWPWAKDKVDLSQWHFVSQFFGWASAILYCCSRIPQIMQNFRNESVEGLSLVMFIFSVVGNLTYCVSIFAKSMDRTFLLVNFPWLLGSGGTLFFDFTIFFQFYTYRHHSDSL